MYIILINGHAGCLKTTLSYLLASSLGIAHVSSSTMGSFVSDKSNQDFLPLRYLRYGKLKVIAEAYLKLGISVVLDGNFPFKSLRNEIYNLGREYNITDVISIKCICSDIQKLEDRFKYRRCNINTPDSKANTIEAYWGSVEDYEDIEDDRYNNHRLSHIWFDSGKFSVEILNANDQMTNKVFNILLMLSNSDILKKPFF